MGMYEGKILEQLENINNSLATIAGALRSIAYDCAFKYCDDWIETQKGVNDIIFAEAEEPYAD